MHEHICIYNSPMVKLHVQINQGPHGSLKSLKVFKNMKSMKSL